MLQFDGARNTHFGWSGKGMMTFAASILFDLELFIAKLSPLDNRQEAGDAVVERRGKGGRGKMAPSIDLLQGTLDMLILKTLAPGQEHGWAIAQRIQEMSNNVLQVGQGSLYPALHRLEYRGWIRA